MIFSGEFGRYKKSPFSVISKSIYADLFAMEMKIMIFSGGEYHPESSYDCEGVCF